MEQQKVLQLAPQEQLHEDLGIQCGPASGFLDIDSRLPFHRRSIPESEE
jgi:hypothetical protein